jgi:hypothetical protein
MAARLAATVLLKDPDTHQVVTLAKGSAPEMRLAVLVTNPAAWEGGRVPAAVAKAAARAAAVGDDPDDGPEGGEGNDDGGEGSRGSSGDTTPADPDDDPAPKAPAKKTAAKRTSTRGKAADQGTGDQ